MSFKNIYFLLCQASGLAACGVFSWQHRGFSLVVMWGLSDPVAYEIFVLWPGIEPTSPALQGGFLPLGGQGSRYMCLFELEFCPDICPGMGLLYHMATLFSFYKGNSILFSVVLYQFTFPPTVQGGFPFLHTLFSISIFIMIAILTGCEIVPHCSFDLHSSKNQWCWASFHVPVCASGKILSFNDD